MGHKDPVVRRAYMRRWRAQHVEQRRDYNRRWQKAIRCRVLRHYGGPVLRCVCCGESTYEFLSLDHIAGGGNAHRRALGSNYIYSWLVQSGFPGGYQVLCYNCNLAKGFCGVCPHEELARGTFTSKPTMAEVEEVKDGV